MDDLRKEVLERYGKSRENLIPILQTLHSKKNYLTRDDLLQVAKYLDISSADVYGTASFYSFLDTKERGKYVIRLCKTIVCDMQKKETLLKTLEGQLNIKLGQTTHDGLFSLLETNCLGHCHEGPVLLVNDEVYSKVTPQKAVEIVNHYRHQ